MSQRNGDRSRFNRDRKKKILRRKKNRELLKKSPPLRADLNF
jgi:hypothetical protein